MERWPSSMFSFFDNPNFASVIFAIMGITGHIIMHPEDSRTIFDLFTSSRWKHAAYFITIFTGLGVALPSLAQNSHDPMLVHLGFGLGYAFLIVGLGYWLNSIWSSKNFSSKCSTSALLIIFFSAAIAVGALYHRDKIVSLYPIAKIVAPLITIHISQSAFPVSVPAHSTLFILPLHPYQTFTDAASHLHEFDNSCGEEHLWPTQAEINSKPANGYEEVRRIEVTNHSQEAIENGQLVFRILYNDAFAGGCMPPPASVITQEDMVSIPALDQGKSFDFVAVNQTNRCTWLFSSSTIRVKMADAENATEVALKLEPTNIPNWASTPFGPTAIKWEGVPTKNPGYGLARSGALCRFQNDVRKNRAGQSSQTDDDAHKARVIEKRKIQSRLSQLINDGIARRSAWQAVLGKSEDIQRRQADDVQQWHKKVENYLRTIPRGDVYLARLNGATRTGFGGYPMGINLNVAGTYDLLISDLAVLNQFIADPELGDP
jgi:hypothetical protein